jgi:beta-glucanase (GH16 family)
MNRYCRLILALLAGATLQSSIAAPEAAKPVGGPGGSWELLSTFSDEFETEDLNGAKWDWQPPSWGTWSWDPANVFVQRGILHLRMRHEPHRRGGEQLFYKSGILRSRAKITYGYFEARIKGCALFPGACPAFWMYSEGRKSGAIRYSEIDIVELQQTHAGQSAPNRIDLNLHCRIEDAQGKETWIRPKQNPELCRHFWIAPWDPRDEFHVYGCHVTRDAITWYIDGLEVARAENRYWHLPMHVTLSLGLRAPYERHVNGDRLTVPEKSLPAGFPTEMTVDYVRVWHTSP